MGKPQHIEQFNKQREAAINTLVGYIESLIADRVTLQMEQFRAAADGRKVHEELHAELMARIEEARSSMRSVLDLLLP